MLLGPGGVVGLVLGAWGALWALKVGASHDLRAHWPPLVAFGAAIAAICLLSAITEPISLMGHVLAATSAEELGAAESLPTVPGASLRGAMAGLVLLLLGAFGSGFDEPGPDASADGAERVLAVGAWGVLVIAAVTLVLLLPSLEADDPAEWVASRTGLALVAGAGVTSTGMSLLLAVGTGLRRALRRAA